MSAVQAFQLCRSCLLGKQKCSFFWTRANPSQLASKYYATHLSPNASIFNEAIQDNNLYYKDIYALPRPNRLDPNGTTVFMFPGQGSQRIGMVDSLLKYPKTIGLFRAAGEILNDNLLKMCKIGPQDEINRTVLSQVALYVTSLACVERLRIEQPMAVENCVGAIGFSVGEIAALVFAGSISFEEGLILARSFGECMQLASEQEEGGMLTLIFKQGSSMGQCRTEAIKYCKTRLRMEDPVCDIAIHLFPDCHVIAGNIQALKFIEDNGHKFGIKYMKRLPVSGAFHSPLMYFTSKKWERTLHKVNFQVPLIPVYSGVDTKILDQSYDIHKNLRKLLYSPVKWFQLMNLFYKNPPKNTFPRPYICEPTQVLRTTLRESNPQASETAYCVSS